LTKPIRRDDSRRVFADLHRHLDGSLRRSTLDELAAELGVSVPDDLLFRPGMGLQGALDRFRVTLSVLQNPAAVRRVASEICEDARADGVTTLEIRFAPQLHGAPIAEVVDAALEGVAGRAGLILCGLYGEHPQVLGELVEAARSRSGVVGIDLAGGPAPDHEHRLGDYAPVFQRARELGLGRTVHAGEGRPPEEIRFAVENLHAQRIGHGTTLLDEPALVDLLLQRGIVIEACPTSNLHTGVIPSLDAHPLAKWLELGVGVCICTDNTLFSDVSSSAEHARARALPGLDTRLFDESIRAAHEAAFVR